MLFRSGEISFPEDPKEPSLALHEANEGSKSLDETLELKLLRACELPQRVMQMQQDRL